MNATNFWNTNKRPSQKKHRKKQPFSLLQYVLETFYEERTTVWHQEPYIDQKIDGMENGCPPHPWNISVTMPSMFQPHQISTEVPHTAFIKVVILFS